jgi:hypothetical protein
MGYSGEASSDVHRVADLVVTRLASKHLEYVRTSKSIAKAMRTQRICRAWGHSFARGFARLILDRVRDNLYQASGSRNWGSESDADAEFNFFYPPTAGRGRSKRPFPLKHPPCPAPVILFPCLFLRESRKKKPTIFAIFNSLDFFGLVDEFEI